MDITINNTVTSEAYLQEAKQLWEEGKEDHQVVGKLSEALQVDPDFAPALWELAIIYVRKKEFDKAITCCQRIVQLQPTNAEAWARLGWVMAEQGDIQEAIATYQTAFALPVQTIEGLKPFCHELAVTLRKNGKLDEAIAAYQKIINWQSDIEFNAELAEAIHYELGHIIVDLSLQKGQIDKVVDFFSNALEERPNNQWFSYHLARALTKQRKFDEAISFYRNAVQIQPEFYLAQIQLGKLLLGKGERDEALQHSIKALQTRPDSRETCDWLQELGVLHTKSPEQKETIAEAFRNTIQHLETSNSEAKINLSYLYYKLGKVLFNQSKLSEAAKYYQKSLHYNLERINPEFANQYWDLGKLKEPDFLLLGVMKCGTTALNDYMLQHPQILSSIEKEPHFLSSLLLNPEIAKTVIKDGDWSLLDRYRDFYLAHFPPRPESRNFVTGEASYSNIFPGVSKIASNFCPNSKLILILRNPVKRLISQYFFFLSVGWEKRTLEEVINSELEVLDGLTEPDQLLQGVHFRKYLVHGLYVYFLEKWMNLFPKEQFLILRSEDLARDTDEVMKQVFDFLGLPGNRPVKYHPKNKGSYPKVDDSIISRLSDFYRPHNQRLEDYLGRKFHL